MSPCCDHYVPQRLPLFILTLLSDETVDRADMEAEGPYSLAETVAICDAIKDEVPHW